MKKNTTTPKRKKPLKADEAEQLRQKEKKGKDWRGAEGKGESNLAAARTEIPESRTSACVQKGESFLQDKKGATDS